MNAPRPRPPQTSPNGCGNLEVQIPDGHRSLPLKPQDRRVLLTEVLADANLPLNTRCGQRGLCEGCLVELVQGRLRDRQGDSIEAAAPPATLRACQYEPCPDGSPAIRVPIRSLLATQPQVLTTFKLNVPRAHDPLWQRLALPEARDRTLAPGDFAQAAARGHGGRWPVHPAEAWGTRNPINHEPEAVLTFAGDHWLARPATAADQRRPLGAAIDVGTTTVVVMVVDLTRGRVLGRASDTNAQVRFGDNVLTRIERCMNDPAAVAELQQTLVERTVRPLLERALAKAGAAPDELVCLAIAGNTTMLHLLAGADPSSMGSVPFEPVFLEHRIVRAGDVGLMPRNVASDSDGVGEPALLWGAETPIHLLPGAAAYVGADLLAGVLASGMAYDDASSLLVDVGTNGEIIARVGERLVGCATAAGPAFEGAGLTWGMRAGEGAIAHLRLVGDPLTVQLECIGNEPPVGICGSAYIDLLAEGRRAGLIDPRGRIDVAAARSAGLAADAGAYGAALRIARTTDGQDILVNEADIATLMQAKAAIAAGITTLLDRLELRPADVERLYLAGGFGMHVETAHALRCGLLPGFKREQVQLVGNTALAGAYLALLDAGALTELARLRQRIEIVELNLDPAFESAFIDHLVLT